MEPARSRAIREYTHDLHNEVRAISGYYRLDREVKIDINGRTIFYAVGDAVLDGACCGAWGCRYALVLGYVVNWKEKINSKGLPVSMVEPITDAAVIEGLKGLLEQKEAVSQVRFW